ncbi:MAG: hypothetical protein AAGG68_01575 [Bacteroidota bacterium]
MKTVIINVVIVVSALSLIPMNSNAQESNKKNISSSEKVMIERIFQEIARTDQLYRNPLAKGTTDQKIIAQIDSVFDNEGIEAGLTYEKSLDLSLPKAVEDSLWMLQHANDLQNHLTIKGLWEIYGYISKEVIEEKNHVQLLLLVHPPKDWDIPTYLEEYSAFLLQEVNAKRMPAKIYATFVDNIKGKILREPQLYGTNQQFDPASQKVLPPQIEDLEQSNAARKAIGLPILKEGEYRLLGK